MEPTAAMKLARHRTPRHAHRTTGARLPDQPGLLPLLNDPPAPPLP